MTARHFSDALTLTLVTSPQILICGPAIQGNESAVENFRSAAPSVKLLLLPPDFSTSNAGEAGANLIDQIRSLLA